MRNDDRKKLLADYAVALVAERESWERLHESNLTESERCRILGEWKQVAAALKMLVRQLRDAPATPVFLESHPAQSSDDGALVPNLPAHAQFELPAVHPPATDGLRRPFHVPCLGAALRLVTVLRTRLGTAVPGLGSP